MAFRTFPLIIISFIAFLAMGLGNLGLFVLFIGQAIILPLATVLMHMGVEAVEKTDRTLYHVQSSHVSLLVPTSIYEPGHVNVTPSYWMAQVIFLFSYIITNAVSVLNLPDDKKIDPILISNRKSRAKTIIITSIFFAFVLTYLRYNTHTETVRGIGAAYVLGGLLGYGWYQFAASCGVAAADVFGIAQQVIPSSAKADAPMTCVYAPKP
jgi:hypothetical protein